jgi:hypothetical protein
MATLSSTGSSATVVLQPISEKLARNNHTTCVRKSSPRCEVLAWKLSSSERRKRRWQRFKKRMVKQPPSPQLHPDVHNKGDLGPRGYGQNSGSGLEDTRGATGFLDKVSCDQLTLATIHKGTSSVADYLAKMQSLSNDMTTASRPLDDKDLVQYILARLDEDYDSVVNSVLARPQVISISELASQMLAFVLSMQRRIWFVCELR